MEQKRKGGNGAPPKPTKELKEILARVKYHLRILDVNSSELIGLLTNFSTSTDGALEGQFIERFEVMAGSKSGKPFEFKITHRYKNEAGKGVVLQSALIEVFKVRRVLSATIEYGKEETVEAFRLDMNTKAVELVNVPNPLNEAMAAQTLQANEVDAFKIEGMRVFVNGDGSKGKAKVYGHPIFNDALFLFQNEEGEFVTPAVSQEEFQAQIN